MRYYSLQISIVFICWLLLLHDVGVTAKNQSILLVNIDNSHSLKLVYETLTTADDATEKGEWKNSDGSFNCIEQDATEIIIIESSENQMPPNFFQRYPDVERIEMTYKRLKSIQPTDLLHANSLLRLNVSHNEIDSIGAFAFEPATKLTEIDLSFNLLHDLNENIFTSYLIKYLYLHNNQLTVVKPSWFENLLYLRVLTLNNNRIRTIDWRILEFWPNINVLHLHSNEIVELNNFQQTSRSMQTFSLHNNTIASASHHAIWLDTVTLDVRNTSIESCRIGERMHTLIAANNQIREINLDNLSVPHQNALVTLHLANNRLQSIENVTHFHRLQYLNLSHNLLTHVEVKVLAALKDLRQLDLSHNKIKRFEVQNIRLPNLSALNVSFNEILTLDLAGWMSHLKTLNVTGNRIKATDSVIKKRHTVNYEQQCLSDSTTCQSGQTNKPTNSYANKHSKQPQISDDIRDFIYEQFHIMEKNILQLIDAQFKHIRRRVQRLEQEMIVITADKPDNNSN